MRPLPGGDGRIGPGLKGGLNRLTVGIRGTPRGDENDAGCKPHHSNISFLSLRAAPLLWRNRAPSRGRCLSSSFPKSRRVDGDAQAAPAGSVDFRPGLARLHKVHDDAECGGNNMPATCAIQQLIEHSQPNQVRIEWRRRCRLLPKKPPVSGTPIGLQHKDGHHRGHGGLALGQSGEIVDAYELLALAREIRHYRKRTNVRQGA